MKRCLILWVLLICPVLSCFANEAPQPRHPIQANVCGAGYPHPDYFSLDQIRDGVKIQDQLCADGVTRCGDANTCCGGSTNPFVKSGCCSSPEANCCAGTSGRTCCPKGYICTPDGSMCNPGPAK
jgi:hypothetical protein